MTTVKLIGRLIWVPIACVLALVAAIVVLVTLGQERLVHWLHNRPGGDDDVRATLELTRELLAFAVSIASGATLLPALVLVIVGEVARIRSGLYYVIGGGAALAAIPFLARWSGPGGSQLAAPPAVVWQVFATAGFAAGLVYWLLAGRRA